MKNPSSTSPAPTGDEVRRSFWQRLVDALFGYDFFISYAHRDGGRYAGDLARQLKELHFECFLDTSEYAKGDDWTKVGAWALKRTGRLILIATPHALTSKPVLREVRIFGSTGKRIIPIVFANSLAAGVDAEKAVALLVGEEILRIQEPAERIDVGPSPGVVKDVVDTFDRTRQSVKRRRWLQGFTALVLALLATAAWQAREVWKQQRIALSRQLAAQSIARQDDHLDLALLLGLEAERVADTVESRSALLAALQYRPRIRVFLSGHTEWVAEVAFSPDGKTLASSSWDNTIALWDMSTLQRRDLQLPLQKQPVYAMAFDPSGSLLAAGDGIGRVVAWDLARREPAFVASDGAATEVTALAYSPDGKILAWGREGSTDERPQITLWDVEAQRQVGASRRGKQFAFSPDGKLLAYGDDGDDVESIVLFDLARRAPLAPLLTGYQGRLLSLTFDPESQLLASGTDQGEITLWDVAGRSRVELPAFGHGSAVNSLAFSPNGTILASAGDDHLIRFWDMMWTASPFGTSEMRLHGSPLRGATSPVRAIAFSPNSTMLASNGDAAHVILWDLIDDPPLARRLVDVAARSNGLAYSPDGKTLAISGEFSRVLLWDVVHGVLLEQALEGHKQSICSLAFSPDGKLLATGSFDKSIIVWDVAARVPIGAPLTGHTSPVWALAFSPDGKTLASSANAALVLWDVQGHKALGPPLTDQKDSIRGLEFSPDGRTLASIGGRARDIVLWDVASRKPRNTLDSPERPFEVDYAVAHFSEDGRTLAATDTLDGVTFWDVETRSVLEARLAGHDSNVVSLAVSPNGKTMATGDQRGVIILWDVATRQPIGRPLIGHSKGILGLAFSPDGNTLASSGDDHSVFLWDISLSSWQSRARRIANRNLTKDEWSRYFRDEPYHKTCPDLP